MTDLQYLKLEFCTLKSDNLVEFHNRKLKEWYYYNSENVTYENGDPIPKGIERFLNTFPNKDGTQKEPVTIDCKTKSGWDISEKDYIEIMIKKYNELANNIKDFHAYLGVKKPFDSYMEFLENRLKELENSPKQPHQFSIPDNVLNELQTIICSNKKPFIESATATPLKWLQNKQNLRVLVTHDKIRGDLSIAEVTKQTPTLFINTNGKPLQLANNDTRQESTDTDLLRQIIMKNTTL